MKKTINIDAMAPTVGLNGTGRAALTDQWLDVQTAADALRSALQALELNSRDYEQYDRSSREARQWKYARLEEAKAIHDVAGFVWRSIMTRDR